MPNAAAAAESDLSPPPASDVRPTMGWTEALRVSRERMAPAEAYDEAWRLYEGDPVRETEALAAGTHPLQRGLAPEQIDANRREAVALLAQIRARTAGV